MNGDRAKKRTGGMGTYQYSYNADSWLTSINGPWDNDTLTFQYDALGRVSGLTPQGGQAVAYAYDTLSRLTGVQLGTSIYSYNYVNANPLVQSLTRPNGSSTDYVYDTLNRLTGISNLNSSAQIINQYLYSYNQQDMRSKETITGNNIIASPGIGQVVYNYNQLNQLISTGSQIFSYDADGNMIRGYTADGYIFTAAYDAEDRLYSLRYTTGGVTHNIRYYFQVFRDSIPKPVPGVAGVSNSPLHNVKIGLVGMESRNTGNLTWKT